MQVSIFSITVPLHTPGICIKYCPTPWGFCVIAFARERAFVGVPPEGRAFVCKRFFPFLKYSL